MGTHDRSITTRLSARRVGFANDHRVILRPMSAQNLVGMLPSEMEDLAAELGASRYRGRQLATWIYRKGVVDLEAMTDLPKEFRATLAARVVSRLPDRKSTRLNSSHM